MPDRAVLTTCPRDCYDACGILVTVREDGAIRNVRGDPEHPISRGKLCRKCAIGYNGAFLDPRGAADDAAAPRRAEGRGRVPQPRLGRGDRDDRRAAGGDRRRPGATDPERPLHRHLLAAREHASRAASSPGWARPRSIPTRSATRPGTSPSTTSGAARRPGSTRARAATRAASSSGAPTRRRPGPHQHEHWLAEAPGRLIVVDPIRTDTAAAADMHLQLVPRQRRGAGLRADARARAATGWLDRAFLAAHDRRLGRARAAGRRLHARSGASGRPVCPPG